MKHIQVVFSPTGGTRRAAEMVTSGWGAVETIDLTDRTADLSRYRIEADDLVLIALPSYGGRVPGLAAGRLAQLRGEHTKCVLLCVYGNRAYEDTLVEMADLAQAGGFVPVAAIAAVAEHSIAHQYATGRPDQADERRLEAFGGEILERYQAGTLEGQPQIPGGRPYRKAGGVGLVPRVCGRCVGCGLCAERCPAGAISREDLRTADPKKCISCMRCVVRCPQRARKVNGAAVAAVSLALKKVCSERKEPELFL